MSKSDKSLAQFNNGMGKPRLELNESQMRDMISMYGTGGDGVYSMSDIAQKYGFSTSEKARYAIGKIKRIFANEKIPQEFTDKEIGILRGAKSDMDFIVSHVAEMGKGVRALSYLNDKWIRRDTILAADDAKHALPIPKSKTTPLSEKEKKSFADDAVFVKIHNELVLIAQLQRESNTLQGKQYALQEKQYELQQRFEKVKAGGATS